MKSKQSLTCVLNEGMATYLPFNRSKAPTLKQGGHNWERTLCERLRRVHLVARDCEGSVHQVRSSKSACARAVATVSRDRAPGGSSKPVQELFEEFLGRPFNSAAWEGWLNAEEPGLTKAH
jgi:hypothetical protein